MNIDNMKKTIQEQSNANASTGTSASASGDDTSTWDGTRPDMELEIPYVIFLNDDKKRVEKRRKKEEIEREKAKEQTSQDEHVISIDEDERDL